MKTRLRILWSSAAFGVALLLCNINQHKGDSKMSQNKAEHAIHVDIPTVLEKANVVP